MEGVDKVRVSEEDDEQTKYAYESMFCMFIVSEKKLNMKNTPLWVCFLCLVQEAG